MCFCLTLRHNVPLQIRVIVMSRVFNFSAGPAALPLPVLERAQAELVEWGQAGASVMEVSHRGADFIELAERAEANLRLLMQIPENYKVLFLQGGATNQFALMPLNLAGADEVIDFVVTGSWGKKAVSEAGKLRSVNVAASAESSGFTHIPDSSQWQLSDRAAYVHWTPNETIAGVEFPGFPQIPDGLPAVVDMSSTILSRPVDVSQYGAIYAGAQKNIGPAGLTVVIIREDLLERSPNDLPLTFSYRQQSAKDSMLNTPPTFAWYLAGLVFEWLLASGGIAAMGARNQGKAEALYGAIDGSDFYSNPVEVRSRSWMNVPFVLARPELDKLFLSESEKAGFIGLKGHRSVGGMRASIYNAVSPDAVSALIKFMQEFEQRHA